MRFPFFYLSSLVTAVLLPLAGCSSSPDPSTAVSEADAAASTADSGSADSGASPTEDAKDAGTADAAGGGTCSTLAKPVANVEPQHFDVVLPAAEGGTVTLGTYRRIAHYDYGVSHSSVASGERIRIGDGIVETSTALPTGNPRVEKLTLTIDGVQKKLLFGDCICATALTTQTAPCMSLHTEAGYTATPTELHLLFGSSGGGVENIYTLE